MAKPTVALDESGGCRDLGGLLGDRDQGRFRDGGAEAQGEGKQQQPEQVALAGKGIGDRFADRKQPLFQPPDEEGQAQDDQQATGKDPVQVGYRFLQYHDLEEGHDKDNRQ
jgi:hypothetical protein